MLRASRSMFVFGFKIMSIKLLDFSLAYRFAESTVRAMNDPWGCGLEDVIGDFINVGEETFFSKALKPNKVTLLHDLIKNINYHGIEYETSHMDYDYIIKTYGPCIELTGFEIPAWFREGKLDHYISELDELLEVVSIGITEATFHILFADRDFLFSFSKFVGGFIKELGPGDSAIFKKKSVVKRSDYIPKWLRNAIFHRDKGRCQICTKDLTGLIRPDFDIHLDHMLPLEQSGTNDPTNFQLLCSKCNSSKGKKPIVSKQLIYTYW